MEFRIGDHDHLADWLGLIEKLASGWVWPALIGFIVWVFRAELRELLPRIASLGAGSLKATFNEELRETQKLAAVSLQDGDPYLSVPTGSANEISPHDVEKASDTLAIPTYIPPQSLGQSTSTHVSSAPIPYDRWKSESNNAYATFSGHTTTEKVLAAYRSLEQDIRSFSSTSTDIPRDLSMDEIIEALVGTGAIDPTFGGLLTSQWNLRNTIEKTEGRFFNEAAGKNFLDQLARTQKQLSEIQNKMKGE